jgi:hypothetical protein
MLDLSLVPAAELNEDQKESILPSSSGPIPTA